MWQTLSLRLISQLKVAGNDSFNINHVVITKSSAHNVCGSAQDECCFFCAKVNYCLMKLLLSRQRRLIGSCRFVCFIVITNGNIDNTNVQLIGDGKSFLYFQNISNLHFIIFPHPIILAFSTEQLQRVRDRFATDVTTNTRSTAQKPWNGVNEIFHFHFKRTFTTVNSSFARPHCSLLFRWRIRLRSDHITMTTNELENVFWRCPSRTQLEAAC